MRSVASTRSGYVVALFNASDDTVDMVQRMLGASGFKCLIGCHFADLKKGLVDFTRYMSMHEPEVVIFDISPPYHENWLFFKTLRNSAAMEGRGLVLTTTNKARLDEGTLKSWVAAVDAAGNASPTSAPGVKRREPVVR